MLYNEKELDCIDRGDIANLEDSPRLLFISEECRNLIVVINGEERTGSCPLVVSVCSLVVLVVLSVSLFIIDFRK